MADPVLELQKAVRAALIADADFNGAVAGRVYDAIPVGAGYPFAAFGPMQVASYDGAAMNGVEVAIDVEIWSRAAAGRVEALTLAERARAVLHDADLTLDTATFTNCRLINQRVIRDNDGGSTTQIILTFRAIAAT